MHKGKPEVKRLKSVVRRYPAPVRKRPPEDVGKGSPQRLKLKYIPPADMTNYGDNARFASLTRQPDLALTVVSRIQASRQLTASPWHG